MTDKEAPFEHKGIPIFITEAGRFYADTVKGRIMAPSVAGLRKKLDKQSTFEPFKAFTIVGYGGGQSIRECLVTGIEKRRRWRGLQFTTNTGGVFNEVYEDTPQNRALAKQYIKAAADFEKAQKKHEADQDRIEARITKRKPEPDQSDEV